MYRNCIAAGLLYLLAGCSVQTSSGHNYLGRYEADVAASLPTGKKRNDAVYALNQDIRKAASVEPLLQFPARIGLARMERSRLIGVPESELEDWIKLAKDHSELTGFTPVNVLGTGQFVDRSQASSRKPSLVESIRLAAAKQHLDAVLIYEVESRAQKHNTTLAVVDLTLIGGAFLPTRRINASGNARALLIDVRNGYHYGSVSSEAELNKLSPSWGSDARHEQAKRAVKTEAYKELFPKVEKMFESLFRKMRHRSRKKA